MHWSSASEFFNMGGYGLYVWGSYGVTFLLLAGEVLLLLKRKRDISRGTARREELEPRNPKLETVL